jgi:hypothetical protein
MANRWLFFLDADGWLVGPESAPFPGETRILNAALAALRDPAAWSDPAVALLVADRGPHNPCAPAVQCPVT